MRAARAAWAALALAAAAAGAWWALRGEGAAQAVAARRGPIVEAVYGLGTVTATRRFTLRVPVGATVARVFVQEGDRVRGGAALVEFHGLPLFRAPFTGTVTHLPVKPGESVTAQEEALSLVDLLDRYVVVSLEQQGALRVRPGQAAVLSFESMRGQRFTGKVRAVAPHEGQFLVYLDAAGLPPEILPEMTADVAIEVSRKPDALLVPAAAVSMGRVVVMEGASRRKAQVEIGLVDGEWAEVLSGGLREGDRVAVPKP